MSRLDATRRTFLLAALLSGSLFACDAPASSPTQREPGAGQPPPPAIEVPGRPGHVDDPTVPGLDPVGGSASATPGADEIAGDGCAHPDALLPIGESPVRGAPGATVTVVVFASFTEPASAWLGTDALPTLLDAHAGDLRVVFKHAPQSLDGDAGTAARAAWAAHGQGRFWPMHDALYALGDELRVDALSLAERASTAGLDVQRFERDLAAPAARAAVESDLELARRLGVTRVPTVFVNGEEIDGQLELPRLELAIEQRLAACLD